MKKQRILIVDDDVGIQAVLAVVLRNDFVLDHACSVSDALLRLAAAPPDLLIVAPRLPDLDAAHLVRALRARRPYCPVLIISGAGTPEVVRELMSLGIDGYLRKPLRIDNLLERLTVLLNVRQPVVGPRRLNPRVSKAIQYLSAQGTRVPTVRELAQETGVSVSHLGHVFSLDTGMSVKEFLVRIRVELAKGLLRSSDHKLAAIAAELGFCDASHLSRVFRHRTGHRPGDFRRQFAASNHRFSDSSANATSHYSTDFS